MKICEFCKVEVEEDSRFCPLCRNAIPPWTEGDKEEPAPSPRKPKEAGRSIRRWALEILSLIAATGAVVVLAIDLASDMSITWARYPLIFIALLWLSVHMAVLFSHRAWVYLPAQIAAVCLFLFLLDLFTPGPAWFVPLALPVILLTVTIPVLTLVTARKLVLSTFSSVIAAIVASGVLAVGLELLINSYFAHRWFLSWSAVTFGCMMLLVLLMFYLRRWFRVRREEIRKLLHL
ncbi:MAG: hypothetical protein JXA64_02660 [Candidatus Fermentibacteraceae bacterium]|nr:hypothetical protein [Candidatus Fermentibacteraceae bacterium]MBN2607990.1 hypothetical protein [Candidatus Fermentibacteraceae bacterium]